MARHAAAETGQRDACLAGGVALNCVANGRLLREGPFDRIWIQPAAGDAGGAVGAALSGWHQITGHERVADGASDGMAGAYLGPEFSDEEIGALPALERLPGRARRRPGAAGRRGSPSSRPTARWSGCSSGAWSSARARSVTGRSSATPGRRPCSRS